ncbi:helix-turn-helix transcriptional regulator [Paenibacillus rhizovicinus]|uniref:Helix-turn-helix transcriptional regulator n=1 Tax=Paenibacillus rhizovicinus TaxID=2704463 RepID=A0A6C0P0J0_9BACL|nr:helix-turn-helix domain-containing protein [Paenibacillus rhizovicinus]QHW31423.1 helix-turn-helix transcriptional regulator [Paenibacillus rhizovicinus]
MNRMVSMLVTPYARIKSPPLFFWLLLSYMTIVALLSSFILYSVFFYRGHVKDEVITYNNLNLTNTSDNYEAKLNLIKNSVLSFSMNDRLAALDKPTFDYTAGGKLIDELQVFLANQSLYLDNMIIYFKKSDVAIEKSRGADADVMFQRYYNSSDYSYDYWKTQFDRPYVSRILPASAFSEYDYSNRQLSSSKLLPIVIKNKTNPSILIIAFADAQRMYNDFHQSITDDFYILDNAHRSYFASAGGGLEDIPAFDGQSRFVKEGSNYYFYKKGPSSGLTYVNVIPNDNISQMQWNINFVMLLALAVVLSLLASFLFSLRLRLPVKQLVKAIQLLTTGSPWRKHSAIKEFAIIQEKVRHLLDSNMDISHHLEEKNSLLRHYAYINQLKNIRTNAGHLKDLIKSNQPYRVVLFKLTFRPMLLEEIGDEERAALFIRDYINNILTEQYPESLTLQLECDQLLSVIYSDEAASSLDTTLEGVKTVLELDRSYCFSTMAVSSRYEHPDDFKHSFEQAKSMLQLRKFNGTNQVLREISDAKLTNYYLMPAQEEELNACLTNGNEPQVMQFVKRELAALRKKDATEHEASSFADYLVDRTKRAFIVNQLDGELLRTMQAQLQHCHAFEELEQLFAEWLPRLMDLIRSKKEKKDHITSFVFDYLEQHYAHDITLDMMADKLNITRSYLSTYFKEKTGTYFVDYVNLIRVGRAKELLSRSDVKIQDAAARVGYQNINSFNRMFKKFTGVTPSEFRKVERA